MERGSNLHSSRLDDQQQHETEALVRGAPDEGRTEWRTMEAPISTGTGGGVGWRPELDQPVAGMTEADIAGREALARHLRGSSFPASADMLVRTLEETHAPSEIVDAVHTLPEGRVYWTVEEVWRDLGGRVEHRS